MKIYYTLIGVVLITMALVSCSAPTKNDDNESANNTENQNKKSQEDTDKKNEPKTKEQQIIDVVIAQHGGDKYKKVKVSFDFRKKHYSYMKNEGKFQFERSFEDDSLGKIHDVLNNEGFTRKANDKVLDITEEWKGKYSNSVNSVMYFTFLPFNLNDGAVIKKYKGEVTIKGKTYHQIQVTFKKEGGGEDHSDVYMYWFNKDKNTMDYFAYSYDVNEGGVRFREAFNPRVIEGITFLDYNNYKAAKGTPLTDLPKMFNEDQLKLLSKIENEQIKVSAVE